MPRKSSKTEKETLSQRKPSEKSSSTAKGKKRPLPPHMKLLAAISDFLSDLECAKDMFNTIVPALEEQDSETLQQIKEILKRLRGDTKGDDLRQTRITRHTRELVRNARKLLRAERMFRSQALVCIVSRYDQFFADILKNAYRRNPARATSPDRSLTYEDLLTLDKLEDLVELFIAKDIDGLLRDSHEKQIETVDREFKLGIRETFDDYPRFIEITERRNLFVHCGGVVTKFYLKKCKDAGCSLEKDVNEGNTLSVSNEYFGHAVKCLYELGVRLGYALACRVYPEHLDDIHGEFLEEAGFSLLVAEDWELAKRVFSFGLTWPEKFMPGDVWRRYYAINTALALNHLEKHPEAVALLDQYDWSTQSSKFLLAVAVLRHKWRDAERIMSEMNGQKPFGEDQFRSWPLFKEFRSTKEFRRAYKSIYGKRYVTRLSNRDAAEIERASKRGSEQEDRGDELQHAKRASTRASS